MKMRLLFTSLFIIFLTSLSFSQKPDTLIKKLDSLNKKTDTSGKQINNINPKAYNEITEINFSSYFILLGSDLKQEITAPFHWSNKAWLKVGSLALIGGALVFADEPLQRHSLQLRNSNKGLAHLSGYVTNFGGSYEVYTLAAFGAYGLIFKSEKVKTTTLLATQAYITGGAMQAFLKFLSGRQRPNFYDPKHPFEAEPKFHGPFSTGKDINGNRLNSSFPSGHTTVAFAAATVYAQEYKNSPIIPILAYSSASLIGLSRITENRHWVTDVLAGAALGYFTGKQVVNNYHRYAKLKSPQDKKGTLTLNLQYNFGQLMPGLVYTFR